MILEPIMLTIVRIVSCTTPILLDLGLLIIFPPSAGALRVTRFNDVAPDPLTAVVLFRYKRPAVQAQSPAKKPDPLLPWRQQRILPRTAPRLPRNYTQHSPAVRQSAFSRDKRPSASGRRTTDLAAQQIGIVGPLRIHIPTSEMRLRTSLCSCFTLCRA